MLFIQCPQLEAGGKSLLFSWYSGILGRGALHSLLKTQNGKKSHRICFRNYEIKIYVRFMID